MLYNNVLEVIGNTPAVKLNSVSKGCVANMYAKLEFMNPGGSVKDRLGRWLIEDAEKRGVLKPGGTIVESTSGNTGFGLALASAVKGYKCIFTLPDKMSDEKIKNLRAFGAKVIVTPTAVEADDPRSYYSVAKRMAKETKNSLYTDQYNNLANREMHYNQTGPEILEQMPNIDVFIAGIGTGGTVCGVGKYLKEKKPNVKIVAVDVVGSIVYEYFKEGKITSVPQTYKIEGIGEDFIPKNYDFSVVDDIIQVEDKESFLMTRELLVKEGIYAGVSSGSAVVGALKWIKSQGDALKDKNVLVLLPDTGNRYLSKVYDDEWMQEVGFLDEPSFGTIADLLKSRTEDKGEIMMVKQTDKISNVIALLREKDISQVPVSDDAGWIKGLVSEKILLNAMVNDNFNAQNTIADLVDPSIEFVHLNDPVTKVMHLSIAGKTPLVVDNQTEGNKLIAIITRIDLIAYLGSENAK